MSPEIQSKADVLNYLSQMAKQYAPKANENIHRNSHMNAVNPTDTIPQHLVNALLVDFVNYIAINQGVDLAMYTSDAEG